MPKGCLGCFGGANGVSEEDAPAAGPGNKAIPVSRLRELVKDRKCTLEDFDFHETVGVGTFGRVRMVKLRAGVAPPAAGEDNATPLPLALKSMKKNEAISMKQVDHVKAERRILASVEHPFIVNLLTTFQDEQHLYLLLEYVNGGELGAHVRKVGNLPNEEASFFTGEVSIALKYLHSKNIAYRDLKPDNVLIDCEGHVKVVDFGFAKVIESSSKSFTLCGTPEYLAPEIIKQEGHGRAVDWWALGVLIFEMLIGEPIFTGEDPLSIYTKVLAGKLDFPKGFDGNAKDVVRRLLTANPAKRPGFDAVRKHRWCKGLDWSQLAHRKARPPFVPELKGHDDTYNFDRYPESGGAPGMPLDAAEQELFAEFG